ncbi:MAG: translation initiation factor IF-1 [Deltaproteobacteria bacterium]|nr:translation initiation factor IF-1 [Deltaproteobacteria bacterium]
MKEDAVILKGVVEELKGHSVFSVKISGGETVLARMAGRTRRMGNRIFPGTEVEIEVSPYDLTKGRIIHVS